MTRRLRTCTSHLAAPGSVSPHSLRTCAKHSAAAGAVAASPLPRVDGGYRHVADAAVIAQPTRAHRQRLRRAAAAALTAEYARRRRRENTHRVERIADLRRARAVDLGPPHLPHGAGPPTSACAADPLRALARQRHGACGGGSRLSSRGATWQDARNASCCVPRGTHCVCHEAHIASQIGLTHARAEALCTAPLPADTAPRHCP